MTKSLNLPSVMPILRAATVNISSYPSTEQLGLQENQGHVWIVRFNRMPVSTRSQINTNPEQNDSNQHHITRLRADQEETHMGHTLRNPHQGLKEKMKALTLLYEQQKQASAALKNPPSKPEERQFLTHPSVDLLGSGKREEKDPNDPKQCQVMRENTIPNTTVTRTYVLPPPPIEDVKENVAGDRIVGFSCPRKTTVSTTVARKLSMGSYGGASIGA
ncbi:hypothetical protein F0562_025103 [Nyssa sinensis]|uniref:Uncharacterized protein n=1 Tax=Nyssa sinensis TaxID=561372 RepID=A0A5J5BJ33_9ASTE|nr:hypothetical protein F0562_025103 [Nyssa sinensis]